MTADNTIDSYSTEKKYFANKFALREPQDLSDRLENLIHIYGNNIVCDTDKRGFKTPKNRNPLELVLDATEGFIPLWARNSILKWRFQERSFAIFENPEQVKAVVRDLLTQGIMAWEDASPVTFQEDINLWDFEISMVPSENCTPNGCVLASAFFPNSGRNFLRFYPTFFTQPLEEQIETVAHELGHIFGLRHFFANISETAFPSTLFGSQSRFTIMNYGPDSRLTEDDKLDLKRLYELVWTEQLNDINGTPVQIIKPFHTLRDFNVFRPVTR